MPLGGGRATPAPLLSLDSGHVLQPRRLLSSLTQKCFISLPDLPGEGQSHVQLRFFAVVWVGQGGRVRPGLAQLPPEVSSTGLKSGFWCPHSHPRKIRQIPFCLITVVSEMCSIFNPFSELALFFKGPGPVPLSSPSATPILSSLRRES